MDIIKLYEKLNFLAYWLIYQVTYLEMKYHLKRVLRGEEKYYIRPIRYYNRNIGKTTALARLSAEFNIPVVVASQNHKIAIERNIPRHLPKYFKKKKPDAIVVDDNWRGLRYEILLVEENLINEQRETANHISWGRVVGYRAL